MVTTDGGGGQWSVLKYSTMMNGFDIMSGFELLCTNVVCMWDRIENNAKAR